MSSHCSSDVALDTGVPATPVGLAGAEDPATSRELITTQWLQIIPPNQSVPIYLGYTSQTCAGPVRILTVDAVRPRADSS